MRRLTLAQRRKLDRLISALRLAEWSTGYVDGEQTATEGDDSPLELELRFRARQRAARRITSAERKLAKYLDTLSTRGA